MTTEGEIKYSVVVPFYNEEDSAARLYIALTDVLRGLEQPYEIIFVDDGSTDRTAKVLNDIERADPSVRVVSLTRNFGQTPALKAGFDAACGQVIVSMDGDLQHDPAEIPALIAKLNDGFDIVSGWRHERRDAWLTRRLPSRIANWAMAQLSGVALHDFGTTFKAYRREIIQSIQLYGELHRFIPALATWSGARITEVPISNPSRQHGKSKYGLSRTFRVFLDLISTKFLLEYSTRPLHFFGFFGVLAAGAGSLSCLLLLFQKFVAHSELLASNAALSFGAVALILTGVQILCLGLVSEILSRTYYESQRKAIYVARTSPPHLMFEIAPKAMQSMNEATEPLFENQGSSSEGPIRLSSKIEQLAKVPDQSR